MRGHLFVAPGDITLLSADAVAYSTDRVLSPGGQLTSAFEANLPTFRAQYEALRASLGGRRAGSAETFWLPMPAAGEGNGAPAKGEKPYGVVVTVATGINVPREQRAAAAVAGALRRACAELERAGVPKPWRIALPTFLTGDGGARHDRLAVAEPQVEAAMAFVDEHEDVDVAFVPYTESTYQVWLEARRRVRARRGAPTEGDDGPFGELVEALRRRECVLFVGSGVSSGSGLPGWLELIDELAGELGIEPAHRRGDLDYLLDLAQWYRERGAPEGESIESRIARRFTVGASGARPTLAHYLLTSLPARYFVTTNYDDLLETALNAQRRHPVRVVAERDVARTGGTDGCYVVKFHGCAVNGGELVLSRDDYDDFFRRRPAMALLLEGLLLNQSFFFVGYGLRDPDFRQIYGRIASMLQGAKRPAFATTFEGASEHPKKQWKKKHLDLIDVPGATPAEKARALDVLLDRLAERVARDPHLFLAEDVDRPLAPEVTKVRERLLDTTGAVIAACQRAPSASKSEVQALADVLRFFAARGWRGHRPGQLGGLFAMLAAHRELADEERRALLIAALRHTESSEEARRLEREIERIERAAR